VNNPESVNQSKSIVVNYDPDSLMSVEDVAELLDVSTHTLRGWRSKRMNLNFFYPSLNRVKYRRSDVLAFIESKMVKIQPTIKK